MPISVALPDMRDHAASDFPNASQSSDVLSTLPISISKNAWKSRRSFSIHMIVYFEDRQAFASWRCVMPRSLRACRMRCPMVSVEIMPPPADTRQRAQHPEDVGELHNSMI